jgi:hypothetical protein
LATYSTNSYVNRIAGYAQTPQTNNYGIVGESVADIFGGEVLANDSVSLAAQQPLRTLLCCTNDAVTGTGYAATFNQIYPGLLAWLTVPSQSKVAGSTASTSGTCANDTTYVTVTGKNCTSNSATITMSITTTGGPIYIWYRLINSDAGTWNYSLNGGGTVAEATAPTPAISGPNSPTQSVGFIRIATSVAGSNTLVFTKTIAGGNMSILAIGQPYTAGLTASLPYLVNGLTPPQSGGDAASASYRGYQTTLSAPLIADGLQIFNAFPQNCLLGGVSAAAETVAADYGNSLHPNDVGHGEIAACMLAAIPGLRPGKLQPMTISTAGFSSAVVPGGGSQVIYDNTNAAVTLPTNAAAGTSITVVNGGSGNVVVNSIATIPPAQGGYLNEGSATFMQLGSGNTWAMVSSTPNVVMGVGQGSPGAGNQTNFVAGGTIAVPAGYLGLTQTYCNYSSTTNASVTGASQGIFVLQPLSCVQVAYSNSTWAVTGSSSMSGVPVASTVNCSTSGTVIFREPMQGAGYEHVVAYMSACVGTASYTFPTAFANTPDSFVGSAATGATVTALSTTAMTITSFSGGTVASSGKITVE